MRKNRLTTGEPHLYNSIVFASGVEHNDFLDAFETFFDFIFWCNADHFPG